MNPIICVDFDGVIHSYKSGWQGADVVSDEPVDGAIDWLLSHLPVPDALGMAPEYVGPEPVIYSARSKQKGGIKAMKKWLIKHGVDEWYFRDDILKFPTQKPAAFLTIDDRAICFTGKFPTTEEILSFVPWNKLDVGGQPVGHEVAPLRSFEDERARRVYYQDIVYSVCTLLDKFNGKRPGTGIVCGTKDEPSTEVQDELRKLLTSLVL